MSSAYDFINKQGGHSHQFFTKDLECTGIKHCCIPDYCGLAKFGAHELPFKYGPLPGMKGISCVSTSQISALLVKDAYAKYQGTGDSNDYILYLLLKSSLGHQI